MFLFVLREICFTDYIILQYYRRGWKIFIVEWHNNKQDEKVVSVPEFIDSPSLR